MNILRKTGAIALAVLLVLAVCNTALAAEVLTGGTVVDKENGVSNAVTIEKSLVFINPTELSVYGPNITYTYTVTPGTAAKGITDEDGIHAATLAGINNTTVSGPVSWDSTTKYTASAAGTASVKTFTISFDVSKFTQAGVYRYKITETASPATKADAGVADGSISNVRYLDVYVKNAATAGSYEIYGYALFSKDNGINAYTGSGDASTVAAAGKTTGFVAGDEEGDGTGETADVYETINLTVSKTLTGDAGMTGNAFPFEVGITNSGVKTVVKLITKTGTLSGVEAGSGTEGTAISIDGNASGMSSTDTSHSIKTGDAVKYIGIPALSSASCTVKEQNNVAGTTYESSYIVDSGSKAGVKNIEKDAWSETATVTANDKADHKVVFTNDLKLISPTGYVSRYAPYALILIGGIALLLISKKHRKHTEDD